MKKKLKACATAVFLYLLSATGSWMFINSYANSYNRLSLNQIKTAGLIMEENNAYVNVLDKKINIKLNDIKPQSRIFGGAYILSPVEIRSAAYIISLLTENFS
ncbi:MAG: hypothetical protein MJ081_07345 [Ruminococcus sp.]|nr:hypothetical protein [Ruminococcus sp.]